jgi:hypothetical protein
MQTGTAPTKEPDPKPDRERMDALDCGQLGLRSMAEFEDLVDRYLPVEPRKDRNPRKDR